MLLISVYVCAVQRVSKHANVQLCITSRRAHRANCVPSCIDRVQNSVIEVRSVARAWKLDWCLFYFATNFVCLVYPVADSMSLKILAATLRRL